MIKKLHTLMLLAAFAVLNLTNLNAQVSNLTIYDWYPQTIPIHNVAVHWDGPCGIYQVYTNGNLNTSNWGHYNTVERHDYLNSTLWTVMTLSTPGQMFFKVLALPDGDQSGCVESQMLTLTHPTNMLVYTNFTSTFNAYVIGPDTMTFQWFKDGSPISGATDMVYSFEDTLKKDEGTYYLQSYSSWQTNTTAAAVLSVEEDVPTWPTVSNPPPPGP